MNCGISDKAPIPERKPFFFPSLSHIDRDRLLHRRPMFHLLSTRFMMCRLHSLSPPTRKGRVPRQQYASVILDPAEQQRGAYYRHNRIPRSTICSADTHSPPLRNVCHPTTRECNDRRAMTSLVGGTAQV